jgi:hypothetical protein
MGKCYIISYGRSVHYPHQAEFTKRKLFEKKAKAEAFLKKLEKRKDIDFSDAIVKDGSCKGLRKQYPAGKLYNGE